VIDVRDLVLLEEEANFCSKFMNTSKLISVVCQRKSISIICVRHDQ